MLFPLVLVSKEIDIEKEETRRVEADCSLNWEE